MGLSGQIQSSGSVYALICRPARSTVLRHAFVDRKQTPTPAVLAPIARTIDAIVFVEVR